MQTGATGWDIESTTIRNRTLDESHFFFQILINLDEKQENHATTTSDKFLF